MTAVVTREMVPLSDEPAADNQKVLGSRGWNDYQCEDKRTRAGAPGRSGEWATQEGCVPIHCSVVGCVVHGRLTFASCMFLFLSYLLFFFVFFVHTQTHSSSSSLLCRFLIIDQTHRGLASAGVCGAGTESNVPGCRRRSLP